MEQFFAMLLTIFYKLLALIPMILILVAIIKLQKRTKTIGTTLMLIGNLGMILKLSALDTVVDYFLRFSNSYNSTNITIIMTVISLVGFAFSLLFGIGFLIFVIKLLSAEKNPL